jgi:shikimate dehydrogenase
MKRAYLLAHPAAHSLSPVMHNAAFAHLGLDARYEALDVPPERLADTVASLRDEAVYGANVTVPHKLAVMPLLDELSEAARTIGAVNVIVNASGRLAGHNTDASGFLVALEAEGFDVRGKRALILGAGGAARAVAYALLKAGSRVGVFNRSEAKAAALAEAFASWGEIELVDEVALPARVREAELLINATSVGMDKGGMDHRSPLPAGVLPERALVCDLIYRPPKTRLLRDAEAAGLKVQNGLPMLLYQGAEAFSLWTGRDAPVEVMREALRRAL